MAKRSIKRNLPPAPGREVLRPKGLRPSVQVRSYSYAEYLALDSEYGGTFLEKLADGAAHANGFSFDEGNVPGKPGQYYVSIQLAGEATIADRFIAPNWLWLIDGIQHEMRLGREQKDILEVEELEGMGYRVTRLKWRELIADPKGYVGREYWMTDTGNNE